MNRTKEGLTPNQEMFCQYYIADPELNASKAAVKAGYSEKAARVLASQLLTNINVTDRIKHLTRSRMKRLQLTQDDVVNELKKIAFSDMKDFAGWNSKAVDFKDSEKLENEQTAAISSISQNVNKDGNVNIGMKLHDKTKALELLSRHMGMLNDKLDHTSGGEAIKFIPIATIIKPIAKPGQQTSALDSLTPNSDLVPIIDTVV